MRRAAIACSGAMFPKGGLLFLIKTNQVQIDGQQFMPYLFFILTQDYRPPPPY